MSKEKAIKKVEDFIEKLKELGVYEYYSNHSFRDLFNVNAYRKKYYVFNITLGANRSKSCVNYCTCEGCSRMKFSVYHSNNKKLDYNKSLFVGNLIGVDSYYNYKKERPVMVNFKNVNEQDEKKIRDEIIKFFNDWEIKEKKDGK